MLWSLGGSKARAKATESIFFKFLRNLHLSPIRDVPNLVLNNLKTTPVSTKDCYSVSQNFSCLLLETKAVGSPESITSKSALQVQTTTPK